MEKDERIKRALAYLEARARPLEEKTVTIVKHIPGKNEGIPDPVTLVAGKCPCSICGHEWMWECEDADCKCCTSVCN